MKKWVKWALTVSALGVLLMVVRPSLAGEYHVNTNLKCAECHTMHYSQTHDYGDGAYLPSLTGGPNKYLLRRSPNELCLACHDGQSFAPDVLENNTGTHVRQGGGLNKLTSASPYENWKGHTLGSTATAPGGTWSHATDGLECVDCHQPHGSALGAKDVKGNSITTPYRNLYTRAGGAASGSVNVSYAKGTNDKDNKDVFVRKAYGDAGTTMEDKYGIGAVDFNKPVAATSGYSEWCKKCHTDFHSTAGGAGTPPASEEWLRHPTANSKIGALGGGHSALARWTGKTNRVKVMDAGATWDTTSTDLTPSCMSCHKAHGNQNPFGLIYMGGTGTVAEEGDADGNTGTGAGVRKLCRQCHVQGGGATDP